MRAICSALNPTRPAARRVTALLADLAGNIGTAQLKPLHIELLLGKWRDLAGQTRALYVYELRNILHTLDRDDLRPAKLKPRRKHFDTATEQEITRILTAGNAWLRAALIIARDTALRRADILTLSESHIREGHLTLLMQKTKQPITLPVSPDLQELLNTLPPGDPGQPILDRIAGHHVTANALDKARREATKRAGVRPEVKLHSLRHTFAVKLYQQTKDLTAVQQALGHTRLASTANYLEHADPKRISQLVQQLWTPKGPVQ